MPQRLSIAMCTFNGAAHLPLQLQSFLDQERLPDELVVNDDGSTDQTIALLNDFAQKAPFPVHIQSNTQRLGVVRNFENAILRCGGDVIFLSDQDDVWEPQKLRTIAAVFEQSPQVGFVCANAHVVDQEMNPLGYLHWQGLGFDGAWVAAVNQGRAFETFLKLCPLSGHMMAFSSRLRQTLIPIPRGWLHDPWIARVSSAISRVVLLDEPLSRYRQHLKQAVGGRKTTLLQFALRGKPDAGRLATDADQYQQMLNRLGAHQGGFTQPDVIQLLEEKVDFMQARARMRQSPSSRYRLIWRQWRMGRYHRIARGWVTILRDLLG
ncbi:MAG: glycosyltransferase family 2 protein [Phycisphaerales bacterium]|jgi:glycosyltransferase involved in cell wall biosynthesis|nr:glycosyltransferase family 2 protein [Phycisphaerales bacterium]